VPFLYESYVLAPAKVKDAEATLTIALVGAPPPPPPPTEFPLWLLVLVPGALITLFFASLTPQEGA